MSNDIVKQALAEIERENLKNDIPHLNQVIFKADYATSILNEINYLKGNSHIAYYRHLYSPNKLLGPFIIFIKKVIRKLNRFNVEVIACDQSEFNRRTAYALDLLHQELTKKDNEIRELKDLVKNICNSKWGRKWEYFNY